MYPRGVSADLDKGSFRIPAEANISRIVENSFCEKPFSPKAERSFRICIPDEWFRRTKSRTNSSGASSLAPSEDTLRRLESLEESEEETEEGGGTAKQKGDTPSQGSVSTATSGFFTATSDWRSSVAQNRLSNLFDSWMGSSNPASSPASGSPERKKVSEPKLISHNTGGSIDFKTPSTSSSDQGQPGGVDAAEFEHMLVSRE